MCVYVVCACLYVHVMCICVHVVCICVQVVCICVHVVCICVQVVCICVHVVCTCVHVVCILFNSNKWKLKGIKLSMVDTIYAHAFMQGYLERGMVNSTCDPVSACHNHWLSAVCT